MLSRVKSLGILITIVIVSSSCQSEGNKRNNLSSKMILSPRQSEEINTNNLPSSTTPTTLSPKQSSKNPRVLSAPVDVTLQFSPCGAMGDAVLGAEYVEITPNSRQNPRPEDTDNRSVKFEYRQASTDKWAGWYWLYPDCNWGSQPGTKITGAKKISFWARGEQGNELIKILHNET